MTIISKVVFTAALALAFVQAALAQTADEIIEKNLTALGGRAALGKVKSRVASGTITLSLPTGGDVTGTIEVTNQAPNKTRTLIKVDLSSLGIGQVTQDQRFDGTTGYAIDTLQGNREITGNQLDNMKNTSFPNPFLTYKEAGTTVALAGKEKVGDRDAFVLVVTPKSGSASRQYIDANTYLTIKAVVKINVPQIGGDIEQTTEVSDYRDVDGVKVPFQIRQTNSLQTLTISLTKVEQNTQIDPAVFVKP